MGYSENGTTAGTNPDTFSVTVRVGRYEFTREVSGVDSPMGAVQGMIADEMGVELHEVHPVTYALVREGGLCRCGHPLHFAQCAEPTGCWCDSVPGEATR